MENARRSIQLVVVFAVAVAAGSPVRADPPPLPRFSPPPGDELLPPVDDEVPEAAPEPDAPPEPPPAPSPPAPPAPAPAPEPEAVVDAHAEAAAPLSAYDACRQDRAARLRAANAISNLSERTRALERVAVCIRPAEAAAAEAPDRAREGATSEIAAGLGVIAGGGSSLTSVGGLSLGFGGFLTPRVALTARVAGATYIGGGGVVYVGFAGPSAQVWMADRAWVGGGVGLGLVAGCVQVGGCASVQKSGLDLRAGLDLTQPDTPRAFNISVEATVFDPFGAISLQTYSLLLGSQSL
jgi:hypothetical protein